MNCSSAIHAQKRWYNKKVKKPFSPVDTIKNSTRPPLSPFFNEYKGACAWGWVNGVVVKDCLINPSDMETTLLSEGVLALFEKWEFHMDWKGKEVTMPDGNKH